MKSTWVDARGDIVGVVEERTGLWVRPMDSGVKVGDAVARVG